MNTKLDMKVKFGQNDEKNHNKYKMLIICKYQKIQKKTYFYQLFDILYYNYCPTLAAYS